MDCKTKRDKKYEIFFTLQAMGIYQAKCLKLFPCNVDAHGHTYIGLRTHIRTHKQTDIQSDRNSLALLHVDTPYDYAIVGIRLQRRVNS